jgi:hypothetical protein
MRAAQRSERSAAAAGGLSSAVAVAAGVSRACGRAFAFSSSSFEIWR